MLCKGLTAVQNEPCAACAQEGSDFCFFHDPSVSQEEKQAARSKGGQGNKRTGMVDGAALPPVVLREVNDVLALLEMTANDLRSGRIDTKLSNGLGYLAGHAMKAMELSQLEKRLEVLESALSGKGR